MSLNRPLDLVRKEMGMGVTGHRSRAIGDGTGASVRQTPCHRATGVSRSSCRLSTVRSPFARSPSLPGAIAELSPHPSVCLSVR
jgi:hypothetical protein